MVKVRPGCGTEVLDIGPIRDSSWSAPFGRSYNLKVSMKRVWGKRLGLNIILSLSFTILPSLTLLITHNKKKGTGAHSNIISRFHMAQRLQAQPSGPIFPNNCHRTLAPSDSLMIFLSSSFCLPFPFCFNHLVPFFQLYLLFVVNCTEY